MVCNQLGGRPENLSVVGPDILDQPIAKALYIIFALGVAAFNQVVATEANVCVEQFL